MINTDDMTKEERAEYWEMVMEDFAVSNKTKTEYCKGNEIPLSTFNYWVNRLEELKQLNEAGADRFVEISGEIAGNHRLSLNAPDPMLFVPELVMDYEGVHILINSSTPMQLLSSVIREIVNA